MLRCPTLDDLYSFGVVWINGCFNHPNESYLHPIALWFHGAGAEEPVLLAALVLGFELSADAGAEQWYKTIAKLMQGRNRNSTHTIANINVVFPLRWFRCAHD